MKFISIALMPYFWKTNGKPPVTMVYYKKLLGLVLFVTILVRTKALFLVRKKTGGCSMEPRWWGDAELIPWKLPYVTCRSLKCD